MSLPAITIYRIEDSKGKGPYDGEQIIVKHIKFHQSPENLILESGLSKRKLVSLHKRGFIYGWTSEDKYNNFFINNKKTFGEKKCYMKGYFKMEYIVEDYYPLVDGQIIFNPESVKKNVTPVIKTMKNPFKKVKEHETNYECDSR